MPPFPGSPRWHLSLSPGLEETEIREVVWG
jgi:hypothetical protein